VRCGARQSNDVLLAIDGVPVTENGEVSFRGHERLEYTYLVVLKPYGATVALTVLRKERSADADALPEVAAEPAAEPAAIGGVRLLGHGHERVASSDTAASEPEEDKYVPAPTDLPVRELTVEVKLAPDAGWQPNFASLLGVDYIAGWCIFAGLVFLRVGEPLVKQCAHAWRDVGDARIITAGI
jgi:hypothetical protein